MTTQTAPPALDEFTTDREYIAQFLDAGPDNRGRRSFIAYWVSYITGPDLDQRGVRGQTFVTDPDKFTEGLARRDLTVRFRETDTPLVIRLLVDAHCPNCGHPERWYETTNPPAPDGLFGCRQCDYMSQEREA